MSQPEDIRLRIISGQWRRRVIRTPAIPGIRPSTDRVRETLFNWLMPVIAGARCCDAFAGTGILGLEALSRGAEHCHFVDTSADAIASIQRHLVDLSAVNQATCVLGSAEGLALPAGSIDLLFLDPPFGSDLLERMLTHCYKSNFMANGGLVYVEYDPAYRPKLPDGWGWHRDESTQRVGYGLIKV